MSVVGGVSGVRVRWSWGGGAAAGGLPPSPPEAAPLQRRLLCAENILLGRERRHKGRATGPVLLDVPLPLPGTERSQESAENTGSCNKYQSHLQEGGPREDLSRVFQFKLLLREGRTQCPEWSAVPQTHPGNKRTSCCCNHIS